MKNNRIIKYLLGFALCTTLLVTACLRDEGDVTLTLGIAPMSGGGKMAVNDSVASWTTGDEVWVNGNTYTISTSGAGASVTVASSDTGYHAIFPALIVRNGGDSVELPAEYHYQTGDGGRQLLDMPLVAASANSTLLFSHLTGAIVVKLRNDHSVPLTIDTVTVSGSYALSGSRAVYFNNPLSTMAAHASTGNDTSVALCFDRQTLTLGVGDSAYVMIPVAAVGVENKFTIRVRSHHEGMIYYAKRRQSRGGTLGGGTLAYATMALDGNQTTAPLFNRHIGSDLIYLIQTEEDFKNMVDAINQRWASAYGAYREASYWIVHPLDMSGITINPITGLKGNIDGQGNAISNLTISSNSEICALFDTLKYQQSISNLNLQNVHLISTGGATCKISPVIGHVESTNTLNNITASVAEVTVSGSQTGDIYFGGIVATSSAATTFNNCHYRGNIELSSNGKLYYGGILGAQTESQKTLSITSCSDTDTNTISLTAKRNIYAGGVIGDAKSSDITISQQTSLIKLTLTVTETNRTIHAGGLIGYLNLQVGDLSFSFDNSIISVIIAGIISYTGNPSTCYIGKVYGRGKAAGYSNISGRYDASHLIIPARDVANNIYTRDPGN